MKKLTALFLSVLMLFASGLTETLTLDLQAATDEELANALSLITAEQRARIKTEIVLSENEVTVAKNKTVTVKGSIEGLPEDVTASKLKWTSSDKKTATVASGKITGVSAGTAVITCSSTLSSGIEITAECKVTVTVAVTSLTAAEKKITLHVGESVQADVAVKPKDATNTKLSYSSSDTDVATVSESGMIQAIGAGKCTITACSTDGSEKKTTVTVQVPAFSYSTKNCSVTSKNGGTASFQYYGISAANLTHSASSNAYADYTLTATKNANSDGYTVSIDLAPKKAGSFNIIIKDKKDSTSKLTIKVTVEHSACYDSHSYPQIDYDSAARYPDSYEGDKVSFSGKVLQVMNGSGYTAYRISSKGNWDNVVFVIMMEKDITVPLLEDDKVTVYGIHSGNYTYETVMGAEVTIPMILAERINLK